MPLTVFTPDQVQAIHAERCMKALKFKAPTENIKRPVVAKNLKCQASDKFMDVHDPNGDWLIRDIKARAERQQKLDNKRGWRQHKRVSDMTEEEQAAKAEADAKKGKYDKEFVDECLDCLDHAKLDAKQRCLKTETEAMKPGWYNMFGHVIAKEVNASKWRHAVDSSDVTQFATAYARANNGRNQFAMTAEEKANREAVKAAQKGN